MVHDPKHSLYRCNCGHISSLQGIGRHQKATGHSKNIARIDGDWQEYRLTSRGIGLYNVVDETTGAKRKKSK